MRTVKLLFPFLANIFSFCPSAKTFECVLRANLSQHHVLHRLSVFSFDLISMPSTPITTSTLFPCNSPDQKYFWKHFKRLLNFHFQVSVLINLCHISFHLCELHSSLFLGPFRVPVLCFNENISIFCCRNKFYLKSHVRNVFTTRDLLKRLHFNLLFTWTSRYGMWWVVWTHRVVLYPSVRVNAPWRKKCI